MKVPVYEGEPVYLPKGVFSYILVPDEETEFLYIKEGRKKRYYVINDANRTNIISADVAFFFIQEAPRKFVPLPPFRLYRKISTKQDHERLAKWKETMCYD